MFLRFYLIYFDVSIARRFARSQGRMERNDRCSRWSNVLGANRRLANANSSMLQENNPDAACVYVHTGTYFEMYSDRHEISRKWGKYEKKERQESKESKEIQESSPRNNFLVGNYRLRTGQEVGEYTEAVLRTRRDLSLHRERIATAVDPFVTLIMLIMVYVCLDYSIGIS